MCNLINIHTYVRTYIHIYIHTYICNLINIHTYVHTHIHTHTPMLDQADARRLGGKYAGRKDLIPLRWRTCRMCASHAGQFDGD